MGGKSSGGAGKARVYNWRRAKGRSKDAHSSCFFMVNRSYCHRLRFNRRRFSLPTVELDMTDLRDHPGKQTDFLCLWVCSGFNFCFIHRTEGGGMLWSCVIEVVWAGPPLDRGMGPEPGPP